METEHDENKDDFVTADVFLKQLNQQPQPQAAPANAAYKRVSLAMLKQQGGIRSKINLWERSGPLQSQRTEAGPAPLPLRRAAAAGAGPRLASVMEEREPDGLSRSGSLGSSLFSRAAAAVQAVLPSPGTKQAMAARQEATSFPSIIFGAKQPPKPLGRTPLPKPRDSLDGSSSGQWRLAAAPHQQAPSPPEQRAEVEDVLANVDATSDSSSEWHDASEVNQVVLRDEGSPSVSSEATTVVPGEDGDDDSTADSGPHRAPAPGVPNLEQSDSPPLPDDNLPAPRRRGMMVASEVFNSAADMLPLDGSLALAGGRNFSFAQALLTSQPSSPQQHQEEAQQEEQHPAVEGLGESELALPTTAAELAAPATPQEDLPVTVDLPPAGTVGAWDADPAATIEQAALVKGFSAPIAARAVAPPPSVQASAGEEGAFGSPTAEEHGDNSEMPTTFSAAAGELGAATGAVSLSSPAVERTAAAHDGTEEPAEHPAGLPLLREFSEAELLYSGIIGSPDLDHSSNLQSRQQQGEVKRELPPCPWAAPASPQQEEEDQAGECTMKALVFEGAFSLPEPAAPPATASSPAAASFEQLPAALAGGDAVPEQGGRPELAAASETAEAKAVAKAAAGRASQQRHQEPVWGPAEGSTAGAAAAPQSPLNAAEPASPYAATEYDGEDVVMDDAVFTPDPSTAKSSKQWRLEALALAGLMVARTPLPLSPSKTLPGSAATERHLFVAADEEGPELVAEAAAAQGLMPGAEAAAALDERKGAAQPAGQALADKQPAVGMVAVPQEDQDTGKQHGSAEQQGLAKQQALPMGEDSGEPTPAKQSLGAGQGAPSEVQGAEAVMPALEAAGEAAAKAAGAAPTEQAPACEECSTQQGQEAAPGAVGRPEVLAAGEGPHAQLMGQAVLEAEGAALEAEAALDAEEAALEAAGAALEAAGAALQAAETALQSPGVNRRRLYAEDAEAVLKAGQKDPADAGAVDSASEGATSSAEAASSAAAEGAGSTSLGAADLMTTGGEQQQAEEALASPGVANASAGGSAKELLVAEATPVDGVEQAQHEPFAEVGVSGEAGFNLGSADEEQWPSTQDVPTAGEADLKLGAEEQQDLLAFRAVAAAEAETMSPGPKAAMPAETLAMAAEEAEAAAAAVEGPPGQHGEDGLAVADGAGAVLMAEQQPELPPAEESCASVSDCPTEQAASSPQAVASPGDSFAELASSEHENDREQEQQESGIAHEELGSALQPGGEEALAAAAEQVTEVAAEGEAVHTDGRAEGEADANTAAGAGSLNAESGAGASHIEEVEMMDMDEEIEVAPPSPAAPASLAGSPAPQKPASPQEGSPPAEAADVPETAPASPEGSAMQPASPTLHAVLDENGSALPSHAPEDVPGAVASPIAASPSIIADEPGSNPAHAPAPEGVLRAAHTSPASCAAAAIEPASPAAASSPPLDIEALPNDLEQYAASPTRSPAPASKPPSPMASPRVRNLLPVSPVPADAAPAGGLGIMLSEPLPVEALPALGLLQSEAEADTKVERQEALLAAAPALELPPEALEMQEVAGEGSSASSPASAAASQPPCFAAATSEAAGSSGSSAALLASGSPSALKSPDTIAEEAALGSSREGVLLAAGTSSLTPATASPAAVPTLGEAADEGAVSPLSACGSAAEPAVLGSHAAGEVQHVMAWEAEETQAAEEAGVEQLEQQAFPTSPSGSCGSHAVELGAAAGPPSPGVLSGPQCSPTAGTGLAAEQQEEGGESADDEAVVGGQPAGEPALAEATALEAAGVEAAGAEAAASMEGLAEMAVGGSEWAVEQQRLDREPCVAGSLTLPAPEDSAGGSPPEGRPALGGHGEATAAVAATAGMAAATMSFNPLAASLTPHRYAAASPAVSAITGGYSNSNPLFAGTPGHPTPPSVTLKAFPPHLSDGTPLSRDGSASSPASVGIKLAERLQEVASQLQQPVGEPAPYTATPGLPLRGQQGGMQTPVGPGGGSRFTYASDVAAMLQALDLRTPATVMLPGGGRAAAMATTVQRQPRPARFSSAATTSPAVFDLEGFDLDGNRYGTVAATPTQALQAAPERRTLSPAAEDSAEGVAGPSVASRAEQEQLREEVADLRSKVSELEEQRREAVGMLAGYQGSIAQLQEQHSSIMVKVQAENTQLKAEVEQLQNAKAEVESQFNRLYHEKYVPLKAEAAPLRQEAAALRGQLAAGEAKGRRAEVALQALQQELLAARAELRAAKEEKTAALAAAAAGQKTEQKLRAEVQHSAQALTAVEAELADVSGRYSALIKQYDEAVHKVNLAKQARERAHSEVLRKEEEICNLQVRLHELEGVLRQYKSENSKFFDLKERYKVHIAGLEREVQEKEAEKEQLLKMCNELMTQLEREGLCLDS